MRIIKSTPFGGDTNRKKGGSIYFVLSFSLDCAGMIGRSRRHVVKIYFSNIKQKNNTSKRGFIMKNLSFYMSTLCSVLVLSISGDVLADTMGKKGTTPYVTHFIFRPLVSIDVPGFKATAHEMTGTTENLNGEKMLDKMAARCVAIDIDTGPKKYIDGACVLADSDGDKIFSTFDTRDVDKSMGDKGACGTHIITGGTGKYAGITGKEPFACDSMPALAGPGGIWALDIPHVTTWEIK